MFIFSNGLVQPLFMIMASHCKLSVYPLIRNYHAMNLFDRDALIKINTF